MHPMDSALPAFPPQPAGVGWPTDEWSTGPIDREGVDVDQFEALMAEAFSETGAQRLGTTQAALCVLGGAIVAERYGDGVEPDDTLTSWSMAKSITATLAGILVADGALAIDEPVGWPAWAGGGAGGGDGDDRALITVDHLLQMRPSLEWLEEYTADAPSDVVAMLFGEGQADMAAYTAAKPLVAEPGTRWCYSSGTTNLLAWKLGTQVGGGADGMTSFMNERLFEPIGIRSALPKFDDAGTFIGSSYCFATARDFARFGLLHLRGGSWDGTPVLPASWVELVRTSQPDVADEGWGYGRQWWTRPEHGGLFAARGYHGQFIVCVPALDLVVVRLGVSPEDVWPNARDWVLALIACFA
jgi:CubicO group peptidase (beta-lactamase class C family)